GAGEAAAGRTAVRRAGGGCERAHTGQGGAPRARARGADSAGTARRAVGRGTRPAAGAGGRSRRRGTGPRLGVFGGVSDDDADTRFGGRVRGGGRRGAGAQGPRGPRGGEGGGRRRETVARRARGRPVQGSPRRRGAAR